MAILVTVAEFRLWTGSATATVPDPLLQFCLDEAEAGIVADLGVPVSEIETVPEARSLACGEEMRRASRLLSRRNSPEAVSGFGEALIAIPARDPDSARTIFSLRAILEIPEGVA